MPATAPRAPARPSTSEVPCVPAHGPGFLVLVAALALLLLSGCWTAERYVARVRIEPDGSYKYFMEGTAAHDTSLYALRRVEHDIQTGKVKAEDIKKRKAEAEAGLFKDLETISKDPRVQSATAIGEGRIRFTVSGKGSINGGELIYTALNAPLSYARGPKGSLIVRLKDAVVGRNAEPLRLKVDGDVSVIVAEGIEVLEHNAFKAPTVLGGAYRWRVENPGDPVPYLLLRLPGPPPAP